MIPLVELSAWTGVLAAALLVFRLASTWAWTSALTKAAVAVLLIVIVGQAIASTIAIQTGGALDVNAVRFIFGGRLVVVAFCLVWPWRE